MTVRSKTPIAKVSTAISEPVRVCFVIDRLAAAGTERQLISLIEHLDRRHVRPWLTLLDGEDFVSRSLEPPDCTVERLGVTKLVGVKAMRAGAAWRRFLRRERIEIVQTQFPDSTYFGVANARLAGVPRIVRTRRDLGYWVGVRDRWLGRGMNRFCVDATVVNCQACVAPYSADEWPRAGSVEVLPNGIDLNRFASQRQRVVPRRVGMVANLREVKAPEVFIGAALELAREFADVEFLLAGEGPLRPALEAQIREAAADFPEVERRVRLLGSIDSVDALVASLDVAVLTSTSEASSNSVLEYLAAGVPVVATQVGGLPELVIDGRHGRLVRPRDVAATAAAIRELLCSPARAAEMGEAGRRFVEARHSWPSVARHYTNFYRRLLGRAPLPNRSGDACIEAAGEKTRNAEATANSPRSEESCTVGAAR